MPLQITVVSIQFFLFAFFDTCQRLLPVLQGKFVGLRAYSLLGPGTSLHFLELSSDASPWQAAQSTTFSALREVWDQISQHDLVKQGQKVNDCCAHARGWATFPKASQPIHTTTQGGGTAVPTHTVQMDVLRDGATRMELNSHPASTVLHLCPYGSYNSLSSAYCEVSGKMCCQVRARAEEETAQRQTLANTDNLTVVTGCWHPSLMSPVSYCCNSEGLFLHLSFDTTWFESPLRSPPPPDLPKDTSDEC